MPRRPERRRNPPAPPCAPARGPKLAHPPLQKPEYGRLTTAQKMVYLEIERMCPPDARTGFRRGVVTRNQIASACSMHPDSVRRHLRTLEERGWVRAAKGGGVPGKPVEYFVLRHADEPEDTAPGELPLECWSPEERADRRREAARRDRLRGLARSAEERMEAAVAAGDLIAATEALDERRAAEAELSALPPLRSLFFDPARAPLEGAPSAPKGRNLRPLGAQTAPLTGVDNSPEERDSRPAGTRTTPPDPPDLQDPSPPLPSAPSPVADPAGEGGGEAFGEEEADLVPASAGAHPLADPSCPDCGGTGFVPDGACSCLCRVAERQRRGVDAPDANIQALRPLRNADGLIASARELAEGSPERLGAEAVVSAVAGAGRKAVAVRCAHAAAAAAETLRRESWRVLAIEDRLARALDMEARDQGRTSPVALSRAEGLEALFLALSEDGSREVHPVWLDKLELFVRQARKEGAALVVATELGPDKVAKVYGARLLEAIGEDAWKGGRR